MLCIIIVVGEREKRRGKSSEGGVCRGLGPICEPPAGCDSEDW